MGKLEIKAKEFNLLPKNLGAFKQFLSDIPDHAKYRIDTREDGVFFNTYWMDFEDTSAEDFTYRVKMPHICVYGKFAHDLIADLHPKPGIPFTLDAADTINLSKGFLDIIVCELSYSQVPYIVVEGWVKEHMNMLEDATYKYKMPVRNYNEQSSF